MNKLKLSLLALTCITLVMGLMSTPLKGQAQPQDISDFSDPGMDTQDMQDTQNAHIQAQNDSNDSMDGMGDMEHFQDLGDKRIESIPTPDTSFADKMRNQQLKLEEETGRRIVDEMVKESLRVQKERQDKILKEANNIFNSNSNSSGNSNSSASPSAPSSAPLGTYPNSGQTRDQNQAQDLKSSMRDVIREELNKKQNETPYGHEPAESTMMPPMMAESLEIDDDLSLESNKSYLLVHPLHSYFFAIAGNSMHGATNVQSQGNFGAGLGVYYSNQLQLEVGFMYSKFLLENWDYYDNRIYLQGSGDREVDVSQYSGFINLKYILFQENMMFSPFLGGSGGYTYRIYNPIVAYEEGKNRSHAMDMGVLAGGQLRVQRDFLVALEWRYMFNVTFSGDETYRSGTDSSVLAIRNDEKRISRLEGKAFEEVAYSTFSFMVMFQL